MKLMFAVVFAHKGSLDTNATGKSKCALVTPANPGTKIQCDHSRSTILYSKTPPTPIKVPDGGDAYGWIPDSADPTLIGSSENII
ncbi:unnamed protein product [Oppiella nova]|uniref:Uncharacterized protein n=1 Tax=Oppiella nova TaxID=334625 RepID=A0A7R9QLD1_9ACAR|nr:unnamed protein product [Oppiella nova]CAG2167915.1 unnamed protein product [Oppiella nova]